MEGMKPEKMKPAKGGKLPGRNSSPPAGAGRHPGGGKGSKKSGKRGC